MNDEGEKNASQQAKCSFPRTRNNCNILSVRKNIPYVKNLFVCSNKDKRNYNCKNSHHVVASLTQKLRLTMVIRRYLKNDLDSIAQTDRKLKEIAGESIMLISKYYIVFSYLGIILA